jgi:hypothetical protein
MVLLRKRSKPPRFSQPPPTAACDAHCRIEEELAQFRRKRKYVRKSTILDARFSTHLLLKGYEPPTPAAVGDGISLEEALPMGVQECGYFLPAPSVHLK